MSQFTTLLIVSPLTDGKYWVLREGFIYHVGSYPSDEIIIVPIGFITDFASIPRIFWMFISPIGRHGKATVIHDYCYSICYKNNRKIADKIFLEAMTVLEVHPIKKMIMYYGVRIFGIFPWMKYKKENKLYKVKS